MDAPVEARFACFPTLDDTARFNLMGDVWTTGQQVAQLLDRQGHPQDSERMFIEMGIITVLEGINGVWTRPVHGEVLQLGVVPHLELTHSAEHPLPVISFYGLDKILNGMDWPKLIRLVRSGLPHGSRLDKTTIRLLQVFINQVMADLLNQART